MICPKCNRWSPPDTQTCSHEIDGKVCGFGLAAASAPSPSVFDQMKKKIDENVSSRRAEIDASIAAHRSDSDRAVDAVYGSWGKQILEEIVLEAGLKVGDPDLDGSMTLALGPDEPGAQIDVEISPTALNLLLLNARYTPIRQLKPRRRHGQPQQIRFSSDPPLIAPGTFVVPELADEADTIPALVPNSDAFFALGESAAVRLQFELLQGERIVSVEERRVTAHPANLWLSLDPAMRMSLAGLVTPNSPIVESLLKGTGEKVFRGYQGRSREAVRGQAIASFDAIRGLDLTYIGPPPSFEVAEVVDRADPDRRRRMHVGQRVLFPEETLGGGLGCCIDIAVLTAAMLERQGLHPLLILPRGHAFTGVWLEEASFKAPYVDDVRQLMQCVEDGLIEIWDSTTIFQPGRDDFKSATESAMRFMSRFEYALDIKACRNFGIRPVSRRKQ